jgi:hypothetical protein
VTSSGYKNMLPNELLTMLQGVKEASAVTTLSLRLKKPGIILVPTGLTESISPADQIDGDFYAMSRISRATSTWLHRSRQDFARSDQLRLQTFASAWNKHALNPPHINYNHFNRGLGAEEREWTIFDQPSSLPTYNQIILPDALLRRRLPRTDMATDLMFHHPRSPLAPCSPTAVGSSFEVDVSTESGDPDGASSRLVIMTPSKVKPLTQDEFPVGSAIYDTQPASTVWSPTVSVENRRTQDKSPSNIVPTAFRRGRYEPDCRTQAWEMY